jgi:hypothetical protein
VFARSQLSFRDLLRDNLDQQQSGQLLRVAQRFWPRPFIRALLPRHGLMLLIEARKTPQPD